MNIIKKCLLFSCYRDCNDAVNMCFCCSGQAFAYFVPTRYSVYSRLIDSNSIWTSLQQHQSSLLIFRPLLPITMGGK